MKNFNYRLIVTVIAGMFIDAVETESLAENLPPQVSIVWPHSGNWWDYSFSHGTLVKIKAEAIDLDGSIAEVRFYALTNLIGVATNPPFNVLWSAVAGLQETMRLKAVAVDNFGATGESPSVAVNIFSGAFVQPVVEIVSPSDGAIFSVPGKFTYSAELLASLGEDGPIEFYVGANSVGIANHSGWLTATSAPASLVVSNLAEGEYDLFVRYRGALGEDCVSCLEGTNHIRVVQLGIQPLSHRTGEPFRFEVVTSFLHQPNVVEQSVDFREWIPVGTNTPSTDRFTFAVPVEPAVSQRFYRAVVPPGGSR